MIIVSGAAGFIGSCLVGALNSKGYNELVLVDDFSDTGKLKNLDGKKYLKKFTGMYFLSGYHRIMQVAILFFIWERVLTLQSLTKTSSID
jgi:UDP-glucose 4-epimerase